MPGFAFSRVRWVSVMRRIRNKWRNRLLIAVGCCGFSGFLAYNATIGEHGLTARKAQELRIAVLNAQLRDLKTERAAIENKVSLLSPDSLDPDLLEERARDVLGMAHPNDVVMKRK